VRCARFELFEDRLALSTTPMGDFFLGLGEQLEHHYGELAPAMSDVHETTGVNYVRDTFGFDGGGQTVAIIDTGIAYDHDALGACFGELDETLRTLLETVVPANFVALPLKPVQPSIWATALDDDKYLSNTRMYLAINTAANEAEVINKAPHLIKVCSANHIEHLVKHALPGLELRHVPQPPSSIPVKLDFQYFSLNQAGLAWEAIGRSRNLAAYVPEDLPNPELELIILLPQAK